SKIEAGKLEIESYEFNLPELIDSVFGIFALTALSKRLELCEVFRTKIPQNVVGDASRIRQILVNFIGNAIKFTSEGGVRLMIEVVEVNDWRVPVRQRLRFDVIDSGIGIPKSRKDSLFTSFSQIDSSFARRFGGTGLGLAISKDLIYQMGGIVGVESVEGEGSDFWFEIPFPVTETPLKEPSINVPFDHLLFSGVPVFVIAGNLVLLDALTSQLQSWNMDVSAFSTIRAAKESFNPDFPPRFVLADHAVFDLEKVVADGIFPRTIGAVPQQSQTTIILFVPIGESLNTANPIHSHVDLFLTKPVLSAVLAEVLTAVLDGTETKQLLRNWQQKQLVQTKQLQHNEIERIDGVFEQFTAPSTRILVVDDNFTNLLVWEGLLEPYGCEVLSVSSGREAINILGKEYFDLVLMDQMMPDLDGLQTMKLIRKLSGRKLRCFPKKNNRVDNSSDTFVQVDESYFKKIPIIVATANALVNMREEYLHNGFNDYIAKPIHLAHLNTILKQWIPSEKQLSLETSNRTFAVSEESSSVSIEMLSKLQLPHVNVLEGLQFVNGNMNNYFHVLESFRFHAPENFRSAHTFCQEERWQDLIIEVHSVKSLAKIIGANQLAALAAELEAAGKQEDYETIRKNINQYLQIFQSVLTDVDIMLQLIVPPKEPKSDTTPAELTDEELHSLMNEARIVLEGYDTDQAAQLLKRISLESLPPELIKKIEEIQMSITQFDYKHAVQLLKELCQCD
ncbi:MAG: response regulator, partial [Planctomycetaceae bacterium]|nr:response regulator [Planctomycetaceae bacterium]